MNWLPIICIMFLSCAIALLTVVLAQKRFYRRHSLRLNQKLRSQVEPFLNRCAAERGYQLEKNQSPHSPLEKTVDNLCILAQTLSAQERQAPYSDTLSMAISDTMPVDHTELISGVPPSKVRIVDE